MFSARRLPNQLHMTVCCTSAAERRVSATWMAPASDAASKSSKQELRQRRHGRAHPVGVVDREVHRELGDRPAVVRAVLARRLARVAPLVQADREHAEPIERIRFRVDRPADVVAGLADGLLEQGEHQLVLAVEVLVEPAQAIASTAR